MIRRGRPAPHCVPVSSASLGPARCARPRDTSDDLIPPLLPPAGLWIMSQTWHDLLFAHWPLPVHSVRPLVPPPLQLDTFDGVAWLGVIAFRLSDVHLRGLPAVPGLDAFPEVNLRTYVHLNGRRGVLFLSLHCPNRLVMARPWFRLPYRYAATRLMRKDAAFDFAAHSPRGPALCAGYRPLEPPRPAPASSLDAWLTERYCYYSPAAGRRLYRCDIQHPPWQLAPAQARIECCTLATPFGLPLAGPPTIVHFAERTRARIWPLQRVA